MLSTLPYLPRGRIRRELGPVRQGTPRPVEMRTPQRTFHVVGLVVDTTKGTGRTGDGMINGERCQGNCEHPALFYCQRIATKSCKLLARRLADKEVFRLSCFHRFTPFLRLS